MLEQAVALLAMLCSGFVVILGGWGFFAPGSIAAFIRSWSWIGGMWLAVFARLAFAAVLWFAAPLSEAELPLRILAGVIAASGVVLPLFGYTRFKKVIDYWVERPPWAMRLWCMVAIIIGSGVFYSVARPITIPVPENPVEYTDSMHPWRHHA